MADTPTIEEIRKRHANYPWPEDQSWQDIDFLLAKLEKRDQEIRRLRREAREEANAVADEVRWQERQGEDYGTY